MAPPSWLYLLPFAVVAIVHFAFFSTQRQSELHFRRITLPALRSQQRAGLIAAGLDSLAGRPRSGTALSSEEATKIALERGLARVLATAVAVSSPLRGVVDAAQLHASLAPDAIVWLTFSNAAYLHFAQNFYLSTAAVSRAAQLAIAALDPSSLQSWVSLGVPVLNFSEFGDASDFRGIGSDQARFRRMGATKVAAILGLLRMGRRVLVSDVDTVWLGDPEPFLRSAGAHADIAVTSDCLSREADENKNGTNGRFHPNGVWFCGHNPGNTFGVTFNTGVLYLAPTERALAFVERWHAKLLEPTDDWHMEDQRAFNMLVVDGFYPVVAAPPTRSTGEIILAAKGSLWLMPLPAAKFCGGHTFFVQQSGERRQCLNVHVTFTEGGVHGKLWRLREAGLWGLEPEEYYSEGRYLSFVPPTIPGGHLPPAHVEPYDECKARVARGEPPSDEYFGWWSPPHSEMRCTRTTAQYRDANGEQGVTIDEAIAASPRLQAHLKMANRYLLALRDGMALAWLLNRTFVFPQFGCLCDRSEWPDVMPTCRLENSDLTFPFHCPLNFLVNVHFMQGIEQGSEGRHGITYREHSYLSHPWLSERMRTSRARVGFRDGGAGALAEDGTSTTDGPAVVLPRGATDVEVLTALGPGSAHDHTAVLILDDAEDVLGGFEDADAGRYVRALLDSKVLYGSWCCSRTNFHRPGATAFFESPAVLPLGRDASARRKSRLASAGT